MYHLELNKTFFNLHKKKINHLNYDNIINKVQYFQNKCGCNKILVYLHTHTHKKKKNTTTTTTQTMTIL